MTRKKAKDGRNGLPLDIDSVPEAVIVSDGDHFVLDANDIACRLLGWDRGDLVGRSVLELLPEVERHMHHSQDGEHMVSELSVVAKRQDGLTVPMDFLALPLKADDGTERVVFFGRDVRVQRLLREELRKARNWFRSIVDLSPNGICITDPSGNILMCNRSITSIVGWSPEDLVGGNVSEFYPQGERERLDLDVLKKGRITKEMDFRRRDGEEVPVLVSYQFIDYVSDVGEAIIETYTDQTDRKKLERLKNEFVFVAAHELRNPVTAMRLLLDMFVEDKRIHSDPIAEDYIDKMKEATARLIQLVDDLLEISRAEAGKLKIEVRPVDLEEHVRMIVEESATHADDCGVKIEFNPWQRLPLVLADSGKLKEIISNLVSNAIKYNVRGGLVRIEYEVVDDGRSVRTRVSDTGIGMTRAELNHVFTKFWRSEAIEVRNQGGTGLGLFIVKELVERMGGEVRVDSEKDKGTTFEFTLPVARE